MKCRCLDTQHTSCFSRMHTGINYKWLNICKEEKTNNSSIYILKARCSVNVNQLEIFKLFNHCLIIPTVYLRFKLTTKKSLKVFRQRTNPKQSPSIHFPDSVFHVLSRMLEEYQYAAALQNTVKRRVCRSILFLITLYERHSYLFTEKWNGALLQEGYLLHFCCFLTLFKAQRKRVIV